MNRFLTLLALFLASCMLISSSLAGVYKHVKPDGSVEFTDVPGELGEQPIEVAPPSSYSPPPLPKPATPAKSAKKDSENCESVSITRPEHDATIRDGEGNIAISVSCKPGLGKGQTYVLKMDGKPVGKGAQNSFQLNNVDRGSHNFVVEVVDEKGKKVVQSDTVTVHLHRATAKGVMQRTPIRTPRK